jgi:hypothetical protein
MPNRSTNFTLFFMVYGVKVVLPTDLQYGSCRVRSYQPDMTEEDRRDAINLLEESRDTAVIRSTGCQQTLRWYHARRVYPHTFQVGDLFLRWIQTKKGKHKLSPPWEGPTW